MEEIEYLGETIYRWEVGASTYLAAPTRGARLMNWNLSYADGTFRDIIHWPDIDSIDKLVKARGGNPILFPFSARTFSKGEIQKWVAPSGETLPMPMHGFARQGKFEITRIDQTGFAASLLPDSIAKEAYPFEYDFEVVYRFHAREMSVELRLTNQGKISIPWSAGHHFYFTIPWIDGTSREDYKLKIPAKKAVRQDAKGSLSPVKGIKKIDKISNPELVDRIHYQLTSPIIECYCTKDDSKLEIEVGTNPTPNSGYALVTWTETDESPFFCIEPWMGPPNAPENEIGLHQVAPGETQAFSVTIRT
ncbi:aldose epimerase [Pelagicoccus albus]|uniref:Aldose epimerase n=1 Tax=Pelagicoccus albus TaxID=415222 RepID=A0A7X1E8K2_9BACT|nr:aldose epimerase [Pelagicoccus albus]MBC2606366.1 aldose epimerase [Pelagicoccus albus]